MKKRIMLKISYDGTNYCGWQTQNNGITVEEVINNKLSKLLGEDIKIIGASRTDSGVHAIGNIAVFDTDTRIPGDKIAYPLNRRLPDDIRIQESKEVSLKFHPRHVKAIKTYRYQILNTNHDMPIGRQYNHFVYMPLDYKKMKRAAKYFVGEHDFASFCSAKGQAKTTVRIMQEVKITKKDDLISITISGNGFLYNMVRIMVGTLIQVGLGVYPPVYVKEILDAKDRLKAGPKAPANGLTMVGIKYEKNIN